MARVWALYDDDDDDDDGDGCLLATEELMGWP